MNYEVSFDFLKQEYMFCAESFRWAHYVCANNTEAEIRNHPAQLSQGGHTILENKFPDFSLTNFRFSLIAILDNIAVYLHCIVILSS